MAQAITGGTIDQFLGLYQVGHFLVAVINSLIGIRLAGHRRNMQKRPGRMFADALAQNLIYRRHCIHYPIAE